MSYDNKKIVFGIERLSTVFRAALWGEAKQYGLSPLQAQILLFISSHAPALSSVSSLAKEFAVTKATVSDAVRVLQEKKLLKKQPSADARIFSLPLTLSGKKHAQKLLAITEYFDRVLVKVSAKDSKKIWEGLLLLIGHLQKTDIIPLRMCFSCQHYASNKGTHYCHLLKQPLGLKDIRLDCPEHSDLVT